jgi:hypothetical protein
VENGGSELAEAWIEMTANGGAIAPPLTITFPQHRAGHILLEKMLSKVLLRSAPYPAEDLEEVVFPAAFQDWVVGKEWNGPEQIVIREYSSKSDDRVAVTSVGFSRWSVEHHGSEQAACELLILTDQNSDIERIAGELGGWLEHSVRLGERIQTGGWLEYEEGVLPGSDLAGFVVRAPEFLPSGFPVLSEWATWNVLVGVTPAEMRAIKIGGVSPTRQETFLPQKAK